MIQGFAKKAKLKFQFDITVQPEIGKKHKT